MAKKNSPAYNTSLSVWPQTQPAPKTLGEWLNQSLVAIADGTHGDIAVSGGGTIWTVGNNAVSNAKLADMAEATIKLRAAGSGTGDPIDGTASQARTILVAHSYVESIAALRAVTAVTLPDTTVEVIAWTSGTRYGGGTFRVDSSDTTSSDNGGTIILDATSGTARRWKRIDTRVLTPLMFGAAGDGTSDDLAEWNSTITAAGALATAGQANLVIDGCGRTYAVSATVAFGSTTDYVTVQNCKFIPLGATGDWTESDTAILAYWNRNQTYGASWITQKPIISIGSFNPGFRLDNISIDCNRICAGIYGFGSSKARLVSNASIDNVRSYGIFMIDTIGLSDVRIRINTDASGTRDTYGIGYDAVDTHWARVTIQWGYCPLLTTGATLMMEGCDMFNGASGGSPPTDPLLWEHRGNTITWAGGRLGNGHVRLYKTDLTIHPTKYGITADATITSYYVAHATTISQVASGLMFYPSETPSGLLSGSTNWIDFVNATTFTGNRTSGSPTLTAVSSFAGLIIGQVISGTGIPASTTIAEMNQTAQTITMSANATSGSGTSTTVTPDGNWQSTFTDVESVDGYVWLIPRELKIIKGEDTSNAVLRCYHAAAGSNAWAGFNAGSSVEVQVGLVGGVPFIGPSGTNYIDNVIRKTADETVNSSTTLQGDNDLLFNMSASSTYEFSMRIFYLTNATADFKFDIDSTGTTDPTVSHIGADWILPDSTVGAAVHTALNTTVNLTAASGTIGVIDIRGTVQNGTDAGDLRLRWAQNTSDAGNTTVRKASWLKWTKL
jgi:hypothetical protein